jgi:hypothetical protein
MRRRFKVCRVATRHFTLTIGLGRLGVGCSRRDAVSLQRYLTLRSTLSGGIERNSEDKPSGMFTPVAGWIFILRWYVIPFICCSFRSDFVSILICSRFIGAPRLCQCFIAWDSFMCFMDGLDPCHVLCDAGWIRCSVSGWLLRFAMCRGKGPLRPDRPMIADRSVWARWGGKRATSVFGFDQMQLKVIPL